MKKIKRIGFLLASVLTIAACKKDLDINRDPYLPADASPELLLPSGIAYSAGKIGGDLQLIGGFWSQHYTQYNSSNQYKNIDQYLLGVGDYNGIWTNMYAGGMKDLYIAKQKAAESGEWQYYIASSVMLTFDYHILVDLYGQIPFTEGLQGDMGITKPTWNDGEEVNVRLIAQLDDAISKASQASGLESIGNADFLFGGDIPSWIQFAKTLKLKILMRDFDANQAAIQQLLDEGGLLETDAKMTAFEDAENKSNPLYESDRRKLNTFLNIRASKTLLSYLQENNDPRIEIFYEPNIDGDYVGSEQGNFNAPTTEYPQGYISRARLAATDPVFFMSAAESKFLQAEAWARLGNAATAKSNYDEGVALAFSRWELNGSSFTATGGAYAFNSSSTESMIESIITQKWIAATRSQAWDSFFDQNRTGYPVVSPVGSDNPEYIPGQYSISVNTSLAPGELPRRLLYPKISSDNNPNTPEVVPINTKMWWHK